MLEDAVDHVGDGLEPAVRVPRRPLGLARGVLHLAHLVEVDERIEIGQVDAGEGAADREALPFEAVRRGRDAADGALLRDGRIGLRDPGQDGDVFDDDGWHGVRLLVSASHHSRAVVDYATVSPRRRLVREAAAA